MEDLTLTPGPHDFKPLHIAMRRYVGARLLAGVSHAVLHGRDLADLQCAGWADRENKIRLRTDHIFRVFSNTKLVTACAALLLLEQGRFGLDDPIEQYIPQLANRRVLKPGARSLDDTEPAASPITIRQLMTHSSGLSYGVLDPGTMIYEAYNKRKVLDHATPLSDMIEALSGLPLVFHPGTSWEYSIASDVLGRLIEIVSGQRLDAFFQSRIFDPLGMADTGFYVPAGQQHRLTAYYRGADLMDPMKRGLTRLDNAPYPGAYLQPVPRLSGGGGLVSTLPDMVALVRSLLPGGPALLKPASIELMMTNQLPDGVSLRFPRLGQVPGKGFSLAGAITLEPLPLDPEDSAGELQWGGIGGTHWWISPRTGLSGVLMTQRQMGFWHPFAYEFKQLAYDSAVCPAPAWY